EEALLVLGVHVWRNADKRVWIPCQCRQFLDLPFVDNIRQLLVSRIYLDTTSSRDRHIRGRRNSLNHHLEVQSGFRSDCNLHALRVRRETLTGDSYVVKTRLETGNDVSALSTGCCGSLSTRTDGLGGDGCVVNERAVRINDLSDELTGFLLSESYAASYSQRQQHHKKPGKSFLHMRFLS